VEVESLKDFRTAVKIAKDAYENGKPLYTVYEANLPPLLRFYHDREILPASPVAFVAGQKIKGQEKSWYVDLVNIKSKISADTPLKIAAYDIECTSASGNFPVPEKDPVIQIGITIRWSNNMMMNAERKVFVFGTVAPSEDKTVTFHGYPSEADMIEAFQDYVQDANPDVICGYNTYGFDDKFLATRAKVNGMKLNLARGSIWGDILQKKTFELASGKYEVEYLKTPGRLTIDLLLNMRREHTLDSYKLDNVASVFLRDKVINFEGTTVHTKTTRGLNVGNYVRFDLVGNTMNPYQEGRKFLVKSLTSKTFTIDESKLFTDLTDDEKKTLEWSFTKDDLHHLELFAKHKGTAADRAVIAKYCIQDCDLVLTLMAKLDTFVNARGMADVCFVPLQYLFLRGQGIKIFSRVAYEASKRNQIILTQEALEGEGIGYEGAIVISPKIGMYLETPIAVLDFNSLYPSSMIGENLSPDTFLFKKTYSETGKLKDYEGLPADKIKGLDGYHEISYDEDGCKCVCAYMQPTPNQPLSFGLIPMALQIMLKKRKEARKKMEDPTLDDAQKSVYNGLQLAYKVVANSIYGQLGSRTSPIRKMCVAACTTAVGRRSLLFAKATVEADGAEVVYGDSVAKYTPVMVRIHGNINILRIDQLDAYGKGWMKYGDDGKELCEVQGVDSWTESGWTPVKSIIRHALVDGKKMVRVLTHTGVVDVTDDHSLIKEDGTPTTSKEILVGTKLLHAEYPSGTNESSEMTPNEARIAGFFSGDGSCGDYECPSGPKCSWALNNADMTMLEFYRGLLEEVYPHLAWNILPTLESSGVYKLVPRSRGVYGDIKKFIVAYRASMYTSTKEKRIPVSVLNGSLEVRQAFWDGLYDADGEKNGINVRIDQKSQLSASHIMFLGASLGYSVSVTDRMSKDHIYRVTCTRSSQRKDPIAVKRIREIEYNGYVYDLTTTNHHFQAGVGKMIVHNTDSIFVKFPGKDLPGAIKAGQDAAAKITAGCPHSAFVIGYEKTFYPFILFCRKRYVGMKYEEDPNPSKCKRASMGIVLKRRDNAPIVKDVYGGALDIILEHKDVKRAAEFVKTMLVKVLKAELPIEKFAVTKQLRDDYITAIPATWIFEAQQKLTSMKIPNEARISDLIGRAKLDKKLLFNQMREIADALDLEPVQSSLAHRTLADRMTSRDPGNAPSVGERLQYVYIQSDKKLQGDRIETIEHVHKKNLKLDSQFYITNQIQNPVAQLFALCIESLEGYREPRPSYAQMLRDTMEDGQDLEDATLNVLKYKERQLESLLFLKADYIQNVIRASRSGPLDNWFKKK
jgi:DNA polymerase elongation subunit (family B)